jgi:hypothetical protein
MGLNMGVDAPGGMSESSSEPASDEAEEADEEDERMVENAPPPEIPEGGM